MTGGPLPMRIKQGGKGGTFKPIKMLYVNDLTRTPPHDAIIQSIIMEIQLYNVIIMEIQSYNVIIMEIQLYNVIIMEIQLYAIM